MNTQTKHNKGKLYSKISNNDLSTIVITTASEFEEISSEWKALVEIADVEIFQTFEWQHTWWKYFGGNNKLHIVLFKKGSQLVGIMPFFIDYFHVIGYPVYRCLKMIGSKVTKTSGWLHTSPTSLQ
ncbi:MAG: hypothetical protein U5K71_16465 [Gracilimonas sp.]|nr:hypothetical protein [Gracilimonas sp.]